MSFGRSLSRCSFALFASFNLPSPEYAVARSRHASGSFGCALVFLRALLTAELVVEPPPEPKMLKLPRSRSPSPVDREPTPRKTKPAAKTNARKTKTHFACRRRRGKNIVCSTVGGRRAACRRRPVSAFAALRRACAAPRATGCLGYLDLGRADGIPVERVAELAEPSARVLIAECALGAGLVCALWFDSERGRGGVLLREIGAEHRGIVRRDRAGHACGDQLWERVLLERAHDPCAQVRDRTDVEHRPAARELTDEPRVLGGADAVPDPLRLQDIERPSHRLGAGDLAGVRHTAEAAFARDC